MTEQEAQTDIRQRVKSLIEEYPIEWRNKKRQDYLDDCAVNLEVRLIEFYRFYASEVEADRPVIYRLMARRVRKVDTMEKELKRLSWNKHCLTNDTAPGSLQVTNEQIYQAKQFPWEQLLTIRHNRAACPFHGEGKKLSMMVKNGFAYCFVCLKSWDTIQFVMDQDGLSFRDAVLKLC